MHIWWKFESLNNYLELSTHNKNKTNRLKKTYEKIEKSPL